jgi:uncharacterized protein (TIGR03067 family)
MNAHTPVRILLTLLIAATPLSARPWTEAGTGRTIEGDYVKATDTEVSIRLVNGSTVQVPLARLSESDQAFVKEKQQAPANAGAAKAGDKGAVGKGGLKQQLIGTWSGYMADGDGSRHGDIQLVVTENEITASNPRGQAVMGAGSYSISGEGGKLHRIDAKGTSGQFGGKNYEGVFSIEGTTLKWCSANDNPRSKRPTKLQTDVQAGQFLMILEKK